MRPEEARTGNRERGPEQQAAVPGSSVTVSARRRRWRLRQGPRTDDLRAGGYPPLVQRLLANRGISTAAQARAFFEGAPEEAADPLSLPGMDAAVARVRAALQAGELIAVFGDFDVDGVTATALLTEGLASLGGRTLPYLPDRFREGYGLNTGAVEHLRRQGTSLLVTADCGTSSIDEIALARRLGMDVVVLDHHTVPQRLPEAAALVNPRLAGREPGTWSSMEELAAVGVAYQLMAALHDDLGRAFEPEQWLDLVALGTVVDMAPLVGENRELVRRGLLALARTARPGLRALMAVAGVDAGAVDSEALSFALGPRLNAAGRTRHARLAYDLLLAREAPAAEELARTLDELNRERQRRTESALEVAQGLLTADDEGAPLVMLGHPSFSAGIVGLVAARLADDLYRPAVVYEEGESTSRASARSIPEFDIVGALRGCAGLFQRFGGHRQAAGFTAENGRLGEIKAALREGAAAALAGLDLAPGLEVDAVFPLHALKGDEVRWLRRFAPCGIGNPPPTLLSRDVTLAEARPVGAPEGNHYRLKLRDGPLAWPAIAFGLKEAHLEAGQRLDVVYSLSQDRGGEGQLELRVQDLSPAAGPP